jgi:hypothetical protein
MVFTLVYSNGFETGSIETIPSADRSGAVDANTTQKKTGAYSMRVGNATQWARIPASGTEFYSAAWMWYPGGGSLAPRTEWMLTDGVILDLRVNTGNNCLDFYINNAWAASGAIPFTNAQWIHVQTHIKIDDAPNGIFETIIDGIVDIQFTGDTKPTAATDLSYLRFYGYTNQSAGYVDDLVIGTGDWAGDIRILGIVPTGDDTVGDWTRSAGANDYGLVDEIPPNTTDYIYTGVTGNHSYVSLADPVLTNLAPQWCTEWCYAKKDAALATQQIKMVDKEGASINTGAAQDLLTSYSYIKKVLLTAPDGTAWDAAHVNALIAGVESVVS